MEGARERYGAVARADVRRAHRVRARASSRRWGSPAYFLVVWDLVRYAKSRGIRVGPGRGSAAGSCVAYCLRIVDIDPIKYDLLFERFLNPGRKQMPDIDMDFDSRYRGEMIQYAAEQYGCDHVAQIVTFSTIKARAAVRDAARVLGYPYAVGDKIAKLMPPLDHGPRHAAARVLRARRQVRRRLQDGHRPAHALRRGPRRQARHRRRPRPRGPAPPGRHPRRRGRDHRGAAHRVPADPAQARAGQDRIEDAPIVTQYEMHGVEDLGLLKMDFLGLRNLDVMEIALDLIEQSHRRAARHRPRPARRRGHLRAAAPRRHDRRVPARGRADARADALAGADRVRGRRRAGRALPARADGRRTWHNDYADRKNGRKPITYLHPDVEEILGPTYGLMIYQESMMRVAQRFAGYSLEEADNLRKACLPRGASC